MENKIYTTSLDYSVNLYNIENQENSKINLQNRLNCILAFKGCVLIGGEKTVYVYRN
jgi:hypothetical protein